MKPEAHDGVRMIRLRGIFFSGATDSGRHTNHTKRSIQGLNAAIAEMVLTQGLHAKLAERACILPCPNVPSRIRITATPATHALFHGLRALSIQPCSKPPTLHPSPPAQLLGRTLPGPSRAFFGHPTTLLAMCGSSRRTASH
eukprot:2852533-Rhodomonas_salina.1